MVRCLGLVAAVFEVRRCCRGASVYFVGALIVGTLIGVIALPIFSVFLKRLKEENKFRVIDLGELLALLLGTTAASTQVGRLAITEILWPYYVVGVALVFIPGAVVISYRFVFLK